jgi:hypothetical protein
MVDLSKIKPNPKNPRKVSREALDKLKKSISEFPEMMAIRSIIVDEDNMILAGHQKLAALKELGYQELPNEWVKKVSKLTDAQKDEFVIKDNFHAGEWDYDILLDEWESDDLKDWGVITWDTDYQPVLEPTTNHHIVTAGEVDKVNDKLTTKFEQPTEWAKSNEPQEVICPDCGSTFVIAGRG